MISYYVGHGTWWTKVGNPLPSILPGVMSPFISHHLLALISFEVWQAEADVLDRVESQLVSNHPMSDFGVLIPQGCGHKI